MAAPACLLLGRLQRDTIITADGKARIDEAGGNLLYAAAAYQLWAKNPGLVARVGRDYPAEWLDRIAELGCDTAGIRVLGEAQDLRCFIAYSDVETAQRDHPIKHFAQWGLPLPKSLLGYQSETTQPDSKKERSPLSLRREDLPEDYRGARGAHLCPLDYFSHSLMPTALREMGVTQITLNAGSSYMQPAFWNQIPDLVNGLTVFIAEENSLRALFAGRGEDLWEMIETIASFNCQAIVIKHQTRGQWLFDTATGTRYRLPAYPGRLYDLTDNGSSFCGAFAAGLLASQDLVRALLVGGATASLAAESSGAFYLLDALPGLAEARLQSLEQALRTL